MVKIFLPYFSLGISVVLMLKNLPKMEPELRVSIVGPKLTEKLAPLLRGECHGPLSIQLREIWSVGPHEISQFLHRMMSSFE